MRPPAVRYPGIPMAVGSVVPISSLPPRPVRRARRGVTLFELLIVLVLLAVAAAVVLPVLRTPSAPPADAVDSLVHAARQDAQRRAEPVRLRLEDDGTWAVAGARTGGIIDTGRLPSRAQRLDLNIDARGTCTPVAAKGEPQDGLSFDPLACRPVRPGQESPKGAVPKGTAPDGAR